MAASFNKNLLNVGGLPVAVYSSTHSDTSKPVFILFFLHGRLGKADDLEPAIKTIYEDVGKGLDKELLIVTFDHRNHGHRLVNNKENQIWDEDESKSNPAHAVDMYTILEGSARDVSFLIDYLPAYLFPESERSISGWGLAGVSLGGHSTWTALAREPRIQVGIPIIGCPDYLTLMTARAAKYGISLESASKYLPESLLVLIREQAPPFTPYLVSDKSNPFYGKKILVLSGAADTLVPWEASKAFVDSLNVGPAGIKKVIVQPETGHAFTPEMVKEISQFLQSV
ncbi:hypothetical protein GYMLUDRAFT_242547 [Collybiopsis luxurians FD-317 M1]|uniref:Peptidase S9 prolyl oligopeptidase catalytic domain-containing protein n=1 Tax=Collybiopsis luxurians FD-317 M1 TaxID=944289 RepID=A0A0D0CI64_9AGAR|nr:hypothetical protein GYMLUDRAFT_242547 [Collybiopsis luxurians FD-317 M1]